MTNKEKFIQVFGEEPPRQYAPRSWWEQEFVPPKNGKWAIGLRYVVKITDKYKAESEGEG